jgi:hypothetical protein
MSKELEADFVHNFSDFPLVGLAPSALENSVSFLFIYNFWFKIHVTSSAITIIMMHWIGQQWLETCITLVTFQLLIPRQAPDVERA